MKKFLSALRPVALIGIGIFMAVLSALVPSANQTSLAESAQLLQTGLPPTPTPTPNISKIGSTDGIVVMGFLIVLIIIIPIIVQQKIRKK